MKKKKRTVMFILPFIFVMVSFASTLAQEKITDPLPDVWVRNFVDYLDDGFLFIYPIGENEVLVHQPSKVNQYGETVTDAKGNSISLMKGLLFFQGETISRQEGQALLRKWGLSQLPKERINSCYVGDTSGYKGVKDGGAIRWVKEVIKTGERWEERWRTGLDGQHKSRHTTYYNNYVSTLEKTDSNGKILWKKVYLYFHPWWGSQPNRDRAEGGDTYSFYYFKLGCLSLIDERRLFLHFSGTKTIYRLDDQGLPKTNDKKLIIIDYSEYQKLVKEVLDKIDNAKVPSKVYPNPQYGYCMIKSRLKNGSLAFLGDYDYTGETLAKRFGFDVESREVKRVRDAMFKPELKQCAEAYYKWIKE